MYWPASSPGRELRDLPASLASPGASGKPGDLGISGRCHRLLDRLPGPASASSRAEIAGNTLQLIAEFPFTGGGLRAFPGLYSHYLLAIPYFYIEYSHNLFLEVALEQGILGMLSLSIILAGGIGLLVNVLIARPGLLAWAGLASLAVMCLHGLVSDAVYGERGLPFVFFQAGMAFALARPLPERLLSRVGLERGASGQSRNQGRIRWVMPGAGVFLVVTAALLAGFRRPLISHWVSNLGAVEMARVELADFPSGEWEDGEIVASLGKAKALFDRSLQYQPENRTANYRLGLIASLSQDFPSVVTFLETAYREAPEHRGIRKNLGYNEIWSGQLDRAELILNGIPEAGEEMSVYAWWWGTRGRRDLAHNAEIMAGRLKLKNP